MKKSLLRAECTMLADEGAEARAEATRLADIITAIQLELDREYEWSALLAADITALSQENSRLRTALHATARLLPRR